MRFFYKKKKTKQLEMDFLGSLDYVPPFKGKDKVGNQGNNSTPLYANSLILCKTNMEEGSISSSIIPPHY